MRFTMNKTTMTKQDQNVIPPAKMRVYISRKPPNGHYGLLPTRVPLTLTASRVADSGNELCSITYCRTTTPSARNWSKLKASNCSTTVSASPTTPFPSTHLSWHPLTFPTTPAEWQPKTSNLSPKPGQPIDTR